MDIITSIIAPIGTVAGAISGSYPAGIRAETKNALACDRFARQGVRTW